MTNLLDLQKLHDHMIKDSSLPLKTNLVFGEGNPEAKVVFIGEAPGVTEDELIRPFVGRAGKLLDVCIESIGWKRSDVYITNIVKRRPPGNRDPLPEEIGAYQPYLEEQLSIISPRVIVPLGRFAMSYFIPKGKISKDHGKVFKLKETLIMPVYHPAAALRNPGLVDELKKAFSTLPKLIEKSKGVVETQKLDELPSSHDQNALFN